MAKMSKWFSAAGFVTQKQFNKASERIGGTAANILRSNQELFLLKLLKTERYCDPRRLAHFEHQIYSQNGEDGIIAEIFGRIGSNSRTFVEIGVGDGRENNTAFLLAEGWAGVWLEGDGKCADAIRTHFAGQISSNRLKLMEGFITAENINDLLSKAQVMPDLDLLSIDIDRNTYYIWDALAKYRPRVVVVEYNATMPAGLDWKVRYAADQWFDGSFYYGASLKAYENLGRSHGYSLVGCDLCGVNAFFVRDDLLSDKFVGPFTAENHYEPPRYWLIRTAGHPRGFGEFDS